LLLTVLDAEEDAETDGEVETERMVSAMAPMYARGESDLRREEGGYAGECVG
jgi:hypothetical protein